MQTSVATNVSDPSQSLLGSRISQAREAQGMSTSQLARRLGVKTATLTGWENGSTEPRASRLQMLAGMLNVAPTWLLVGQGEAPQENYNPTEIERLREQVARLKQQSLAMADDLTQLEQRLGCYESFSS